jgi:ribonuclease Z
MLHALQVDVVDGLTWTIPCEGGFTATAAQLQHRVPCWGYVFQEPGRAPSPDPALLARTGLQEARASVTACPIM